MKRRDFLLLSLAPLLVPYSCSEPKKYLGKLSELKNQEIYQEFNGNKIYIYFVDNQINILNLTCTHKKCTVEKKGDIWICPCHKGKFDKNGKKLEGKPSRDLFLYNYEINNNELWVLNQIKNP